MSSKTKAGKIRHGKDIISLNIVAYAFTGIVAILCLIPFIIQGVDDDMHMDIPAVVMPVRVGAD